MLLVSQRFWLSLNLVSPGNVTHMLLTTVSVITNMLNQASLTGVLLAAVSPMLSAALCLHPSASFSALASFRSMPVCIITVQRSKAQGTHCLGVSVALGFDGIQTSWQLWAFVADCACNWFDVKGQSFSFKPCLQYSENKGVPPSASRRAAPSTEQHAHPCGVLMGREKGGRGV